MSEQIPTAKILAAALRSAGAPVCMIEKAEAFEYDDFKATHTATPCLDLLRDLEVAAAASFEKPARRLTALRERALKGEFDAQKWESDAWAKSMANDPELGPLLKMMKP